MTPHLSINHDVIVWTILVNDNARSIRALVKQEHQF